MGTINGNLIKKLKELSNIPETDYPFITLYMDVNSRELFEQNRKNRIFLKNSIRKIENKLRTEANRYKLISFRNDTDRIQDFVENSIISKAHGIAIFACDKLGIFETFQTIMPFKNDFVVNSIPHLKQLAYQAEESENTLVIMLDSKYAKLYHLKLGGFIIEESTIEHEVHRFHHQGGWAQMRYQRHIDNQIHKHYADVTNTVIKFLDEYKYENVILVGQQFEIKRFQEMLPKRVKIKVISIDNIYMRENINNILESIVDDLKVCEDKKEFNYVEEIIEKAPVNSVTGMQDTIKLVQDGRSEILVIPDYKTYHGWKCNGCLYIEKDQHQAGCASCNGNARETDIIEELVRLNLRNKGKIEIIKNYAAQKLENYEGIGALIRY